MTGTALGSFITITARFAEVAQIGSAVTSFAESLALPHGSQEEKFRTGIDESTIEKAQANRHESNTRIKEQCFDLVKEVCR
jgi:hypothetical protein